MMCHGTDAAAKRDEGRLGFIAIELTVTPHRGASSMRSRGPRSVACLVSLALDVPVHVEIGVRPRKLVVV